MEDAETMMASNPTNSLAKEKETASKGGKLTFILYRYAKIIDVNSKGFQIHIH